MSSPAILDLFCGAGGASAGYERAGFEVVGVDLVSSPRYPYQFVQGDALAFLEAGGAKGFAAIHASPPCQRYSSATKVHGDEIIDSHPDLIAPVRELLEASGLPYIIENVPGAPMLEPAIVLCGSMFGLEVRRHRIFEGSVPILPPFACDHSRPAVPVYGHTGAGANRGRERERGRSNGVADWRRAMGIEWMSRDELAEAIPPAYTEWLGAHLLELVSS
jgi:DNA (cytosine-5)-methyltransferase 1